MSDLSIIIVSWNAKEYLLRCLQSLDQQISVWNTEIIVVDNASSDGSLEAIREHFPSVQIIENDRNLGFAKANNIGIERSTGRYLFLINSDVIVQPDCLFQLVSYMDEHPKAGLVGPKILNSDLTLQVSYRPFPTLWNSFCRALALDTVFRMSTLTNTGIHAVQLGSGRQVDILSGCFWMVRRAALGNVGLLDESFFMYAEDKDWCVRFWRAGWCVIYFLSAEAIHFGGASSSREPARFYVEQHRANLRYWKKHHGRLSQKGIVVIMLLHQLARVAAGVLVYCVRPSQRLPMRLLMQRWLVCIRYLLLGDLHAEY